MTPLNLISSPLPYQLRLALNRNDRHVRYTIDDMNQLPSRRSAPLPGWRRAVLRVSHVLARDGIRGLGIAILGATVYRRLLLMELSLDQPASAPSPTVSVEVDVLGRTDIDDYLDFRPEADPFEIRRRLDNGCLCFVARTDGRIVHAGWAVMTRAWVQYLGCELPLEQGDVYQFDSFTEPASRGKGLARTRITVMARHLRQQGHRRLLAAVLPENAAAFGPLQAVGYRTVGMLGMIRLGPWRHVLHRVRRPGAPGWSPASAYWDGVVEEAMDAASIHAWRAYMQSVYSDLARAWLPRGAGVGLKTDLFEEATTSHHLLPELGPGSIGLDCSPAVVRAARARLRREEHHHRLVVGDLRQVPLRSGSVQRVLAGSSLDHFAARADLDAGLAELARVLAPGGVLLLTLDNPRNPLVWLRNHLPFSWLHRVGLVPYFVGVTYGPHDARARLEGLGLSVTEVTAVAHAPRAPAIWVARIAERIGATAVSRWLSGLLWRFEALQRWPTRYRTGYYVAVRARKPGDDEGDAGASCPATSRAARLAPPSSSEAGGPHGVPAVSR